MIFYGLHSNFSCYNKLTFRKRADSTRFVLFYSSVESFNYFTDQIVKELENRGHETFILNLENLSGQAPNCISTCELKHSLNDLSQFLNSSIDMVISYDGLGINQEMFIQLWDSINVLCVNILMDHPLRFHVTMTNHPKRYIQFCCDHDHVAYVQKYFSEHVPEVYFMPHAGTLPSENNISSMDASIYDVLFCGTYYQPDSYFDTIDSWFEAGSTLNQFYKTLADYMITNHNLSTEQAVLDVVELFHMEVTPDKLLSLFRFSEPIDWRARMFFREKVITTLIDSGADVWLLGRGWQNHPSFGAPNMHQINERVPFADTLPFMQKAKINLNIMPWFKSGTHDRIFNIFLNHSLPITDPSSWLLNNYPIWETKKDNETGCLPVFELDHIENLPATINYFIKNDSIRQDLILRGQKHTKANYTWKNIVDTLLSFH